jgi:hypothetical protein
MSITYIGNTSREVVVGESARVTYVFKSTTTRDNELSVYNNRYCPKVWQEHPEYRSLFVKPGDISISQTSPKDWTRWEVDATFSVLTAAEERDRQESEEDGGRERDEPNWDVHVSVSYDDLSVPVKDIEVYNRYLDTLDVHPVVNSALQPYDTPPEIFKQDITINISRNVPVEFGILKELDEWSNTINIEEWEFRHQHVKVKIPKGFGRLKFRLGENARYEPKDFNKTAKKSDPTKWYCPLEAQIVVKSQDDWNLKLLDIGTYELEGGDMSHAVRVAVNNWTTDKKKKPFYDDDDNRKMELLDGAAKKLKKSAKPVYNTYYPYIEKNHKAFAKRMTRKINP